MKKYLKITVGIIVLIITVIACQREISPNSNSFNVGTAKEWWYGTYRKTSDYNKINWYSLLAPPAGSSTKKYPHWGKAISYKKSTFNIVELPLFYNTNNTFYFRECSTLIKQPKVSGLRGALFISFY